MDLNTASEILLIVVSSALTVFLIVAIILLVKLIQVADKLKLIADKAEKLANSAEAIGDFFRKSAGPVAVGKFMSNIVENVMKRRKHKEDD